MWINKRGENRLRCGLYSDAHGGSRAYARAGNRAGRGREEKRELPGKGSQGKARVLARGPLRKRIGRLPPDEPANDA